MVGRRFRPARGVLKAGSRQLRAARKAACRITAACARRVAGRPDAPREPGAAEPRAVLPGVGPAQDGRPVAVPDARQAPGGTRAAAPRAELASNGIPAAAWKPGEPPTDDRRVRAGAPGPPARLDEARRCGAPPAVRAAPLAAPPVPRGPANALRAARCAGPALQGARPAHAGPALRAAPPAWPPAPDARRTRTARRPGDRPGGGRLRPARVARPAHAEPAAPPAPDAPDPQMAPRPAGRLHAAHQRAAPYRPGETAPTPGVRPPVGCPAGLCPAETRPPDPASGGNPCAAGPPGPTRRAGPGADRRAGTASPAGGAVRCCCRASAGVTPRVAVVGASGSRPCTGRACASIPAGADRASGRIGRDIASAEAGTTVAAPRLRNRSSLSGPAPRPPMLRTWWKFTSRR